MWNYKLVIDHFEAQMREHEFTIKRAFKFVANLHNEAKLTYGEVKNLRKYINQFMPFKRTFETTGDYWNCRCKENYVRSKGIEVCKICNTNKSTQPNSTADEVISQFADNVREDQMNKKEARKMPI